MRSIVVLALVLCLAVPLAHGEELVTSGVLYVPTVEEKDDWYGQADFSIGVLQDLKTGDEEPWWNFPLGGFRAVEFRGGFVVDPEDVVAGPKAAVVAALFHLGNAQEWGLDTGWAKYISVSVGPYAKYEFESEEFSGGVTANLLEFSFGGGIEEQRNR